MHSYFHMVEMVQMDGKLVLVVEDHKPVATLLCRLAERCGARTEVAHDGRQALKSMRTEKPNLVLLDLIMPIMSGRELLAVMETDPDLQDVPVVVVTTEEELGDTVERELPHVCKPFSPAEVEKLMRETAA